MWDSASANCRFSAESCRRYPRAGRAADLDDQFVVRCGRRAARACRQDCQRILDGCCQIPQRPAPGRRSPSRFLHYLSPDVLGGAAQDRRVGKVRRGCIVGDLGLRAALRSGVDHHSGFRDCAIVFSVAHRGATIADHRSAGADAPTGAAKDQCPGTWITAYTFHCLRWGCFSACLCSWKSAGVSARGGWRKTPRERKPASARWRALSSPCSGCLSRLLSQERPRDSICAGS